MPISEEQTKVYDLIYAGEARQEIEAIILEKYPEAKIEDASDFIHQGRFGVTIENVKREDWLTFIAYKGLHDLSFNFQMSGMEDIELIKRVVANTVALQKEDELKKKE